MAGWRTVVVNTHSKLSYKNNHLIFKDAYKTELIHLSEIDILLIRNDRYCLVHYAGKTASG
ncbi:cytoplasmic protein [Streptococcus pyogenes]|nr:cytoplasmic protein [Streptococcus pyogenes]VGV56071.1 cytoplasmic protein [Streptococcus pyogenes]VHB24767.1 cytoplasmic protein [Streptococcus pyogenes]VHB65133.1 cytoplasmic protein [Streptococcus pyogenes]VHB65480.1 cytoplasmic protein [Streptococcus pyogenes]